MRMIFVTLVLREKTEILIDYAHIILQYVAYNSWQFVCCQRIANCIKYVCHIEIPDVYCLKLAINLSCFHYVVKIFNFSHIITSYKRLPTPIKKARRWSCSGDKNDTCSTGCHRLLAPNDLSRISTLDVTSLRTTTSKLVSSSLLVMCEYRLLWVATEKNMKLLSWIAFSRAGEESLCLCYSSLYKASSWTDIPQYL